MVDLDYYDRWYNKGPDLHRSLGMIVAVLLVLRLSWRCLNPHPQMTGKAWETYAAHRMAQSLYIVLFAIVISGYLVSTADGRPIVIFNWIEVPAVLSLDLFGDINRLEDKAGLVHKWLSYLLMVLVSGHAMAAVKHQVIDRDNTLGRMLGLKSRR